MCNSSAITKYLAEKVTQDIKAGNWGQLAKITPILNDLALFAHYVTFTVNDVDSYLGPIFPWDAMTLLQRRSYITSLIKSLKEKNISICMLYSEMAEYFISSTPTDGHIDSIETHLAWESIWKSQKEIELLKTICEKTCEEMNFSSISITRKNYRELAKADTWDEGTLYIAENGIIGDLLRQLIPSDHKIHWFHLPNGSNGDGKNIFLNRAFDSKHPIYPYVKDCPDLPDKLKPIQENNSSPDRNKTE